MNIHKQTTLIESLRSDAFKSLPTIVTLQLTTMAFIIILVFKPNDISL